MSEVKELNKKRAFEYYNNEANLGNMQAAFILSAMYKSGIGVDQNEKVAMDWLVVASEGDHATAQYNMGVHYHDKKDYIQSIEWLYRSHKNGHLHALNEMNDIFKERPEIIGEILIQSNENKSKIKKSNL